MRAICDKHGSLLIFDEVICGFGRTGHAFAAQAFGVTPDIMTMAKAINNGSIPMGAVAVREGVCQTIMDVAAPDAIEFFHGYTYSAHPVACAAAIAALRIYHDEDLFARAQALSPAFLDLVAGMRDLPIVTDTRGYGLLGAFDLAPGQTPGARGFEIVKACFAAGIVVRVAGDTIILAPPFVAEQSDLDEMFAILRRVLATI